MDDFWRTGEVGEKNSKFQAPSSRKAPIPKHQDTRKLEDELPVLRRGRNSQNINLVLGFCGLEFGAFLVFDVWNLCFLMAYFPKKHGCFLGQAVVYCGTDASVADMPALGNEHRNIMQSTIEETAVMQKTRELCQTLLEQPNMQSIRQRIDTFMGDEAARSQYEDLVNKGQALQQKQQMSMPLSGEEIADFEQHRDTLLKNPVAKNFLDAQEELHEVQHSIQQYVSKTLELGRMPSEEDLSGGGCGSGSCGCGHGH
ncbi:MAG TPA: YlbF family regulator [Candidatus Binatia bacterium]|nr:YlbF family regulator [Candidatus Binatia bacterium]